MKEESNYTYKLATVKDIKELVKTRIIVLRAANKLSDDVDMSEVERESYDYYIKTLDLLVKAAVEKGVKQIALEATDMGRPLYEKYGFVRMEDEMEYGNV